MEAGEWQPSARCGEAVVCHLLPWPPPRACALLPSLQGEEPGRRLLPHAESALSGWGTFPVAWLAVGCAAGGAPSLEAGQVLHGVELCYLKVRPSTLTGEQVPGETDAFPRGWHIIPGHCDEDQDFMHCEHREVKSLAQARESEMRPVRVSADKWLLF